MKIHGTMWDSTAGAWPAGARLRALYANGRFTQLAEGYGRGRVYIDVRGDVPGAASWLDVESGDAEPGQVGHWLDERHRSGGGGIYCSRDNLAAVEASAGSRPHLLWVATLDGTLDIGPIPGAGHLVAVQALPASMLGFNADLSLVIDEDYWTAHAA